jgi:hypothetical protein
VHPDGRILYFSRKRFIKQIGTGNRCFICGADPSEVAFNDEHVLPDWLLRMFSLHNKQITLPNLSQYRYGQYKVPCCRDCNSKMGALIETPISKIITGGADAVRRHLDSEGPVLLFTWLSLIFLKTHLRDRAFREHLDQRKSDGKIADWYDWEEMHHIHCVARSFHTRAAWDARIAGSLLVIKAAVDPGHESFDYADLHAARTVLIRMNDVCLIAVLNDAGEALPYVQNNDLSRIDTPPAGIQLRELMARFALINMKLWPRPVFATAIHESGLTRLVAQFPNGLPHLQKIRKRELGMLMYGAMLPGIESAKDKYGKLLASRVKRGQVSFLYDSSGRFIQKSFVPIMKAPRPRRATVRNVTQKLRRRQRQV